LFNEELDDLYKLGLAVAAAPLQRVCAGRDCIADAKPKPGGRFSPQAGGGGWRKRTFGVN
jgi:hypothetical protein